MEELEKKIISAINKIGPTFISKLANRILEDQNQVKETVKKLIEEKILERVEGTMVSYKTKENNFVIKHRNHTYYKLTRLGERKAKEIDDDLMLREAFKTYNKSLQNKLDNTAEQEEEKIQCVINFPYSQEINVKSILEEEYEILEKEYEETITLRGEISSEQRNKIQELPNVVVI